MTVRKGSRRPLWAAAVFAMVMGLTAPVVSAANEPQNDPVTFVDPFIGTGGTSGVGLIDDYPGASAPFGMLQWSPDTTSQPPAGGYFYRDTRITGFSLTHLSGAGCAVFGDFGVLPTIGDVRDPKDASLPFSHNGEEASPGYYSVQVGQGIRVSLAASARSGLGVFTFPATTRANILVNAASDQAGATQTHIWIAGPAEIDGSATSGGFCGMPNEYTVYFAMIFDRPFAADGTWNGDAVSAAAQASSTQSGAWVTFDAAHDPTVKVRAAISYVSVQGARANLTASPQSWDFEAVRSATARAWRNLLNRIRITGGSTAEQRIFYTALYHALLSPTVFSDVDGSYLGFDGRVHRDRPGHDEYSNFSGWDIYRTQVPLMALLAPHEASDMMQSLVDAARQGGWMPKWPVAAGYTGVMGGDSADAIIAGAYAFGARDFDRAAALRAMVKSATDTGSVPGQGWYVTRPGLDEYLRAGYVVNTHTTSVSPVANGASETLEYAIDDFAIAQLARSAGSGVIYRQFMRRSRNWANLFNSSTGLIAPRDAEGAFLQTALTENGQSGFQEGNAFQYTWMVPQALGSLVAGLGGSAYAIQRLDTFFSKLNTGQDEPYAWFGNEPTLASPWTYLYAGAPYKAQAVSRAAILQLYAATPDGLPGNDDLGTMSAWWVWNAMGLYPIDPGVPLLLLGAPLFTHVQIESPSGRTVVIDAPQASDGNAFVQGLRMNGRDVDRAWMFLPASGAVHLEYVLGSQPNVHFASSGADAPPNYAYGLVRFPASTTSTLAMQAQTIAMAPGDTSFVEFTARTPDAALTWNALAPAGIQMAPARGLVSRAAIDAPVRSQISAASSLSSGLYDVQIRARAANGAVVPHLTAVVRVAHPGEALPLLYAANFSDDTITPFDPRTLAYGNAIAVGSRPGDLAVSSDGGRVYTANQGSNDVSVVDIARQRTIATVRVGKVPAGIRLAPNASTLWVTNYADGTLQTLDATTLKAGPAFRIGSNPEQLALAPDGSRIYVALQGENALGVFDTSSSRVVARVAVGRHPLGVAISADGARVYVSNEASNDVTVVDTLALRTVADVPVGKTPEGLAISPDGSLLYVADSGSNQITPIDLRRPAALPAIAVGNGPFAVAFDASGGRAFVVNSGDGDCSVVDVGRASIVASVPMGSFPIAIAR